jgi:MSHA pilin protein MshD
MCIDARLPRERHQRGLTLIELIMFIVIVSVGVAGILTVMNQVVRASADPMLAKQAVAFADAVLEEVLSKAYCDPDLVPPACTVSQETTRQLWDDVQDYANETIAGTDLLSGADTALLVGYSAAIVVTDVNVSEVVPPQVAIAMKRVTVTVTVPGGATYAVSGYRANY